MNIGALKPKNQNFLVTRYQTAGEIAGAILKAIGESKEAAQVIAPYFKNKDPEKSAKLIFLFCKRAIPYVREGSNKQTAKTLPRILSDAHKIGANNQKIGGDCKHYTIAAASLCKAIGIPCKVRLISQDHFNTSPTHIYVVARINGKDIVIDGVLKNFNNEARYNYKYDIKI